MKKFLALFLSLLLLLGMLPGSVLAATSDPYEEPTCPQCGSQSFDPSNYIEQYPTCTQPGSRSVGVCSNCGRIYEPIPALGHDWDYGTETQAPTCTESGVRTHHCQRTGTGASSSDASGCPAVWHETIEPLGHDWGEWERIKEPTPTEPGEEKRVCNRCGIEEIRYIEFIPPTPELVTFTKELRSTPKNGEYYEYGEWISYSLSLFYMSDELPHVFTDVVFTDPLIDGGQTPPDGTQSEPLDSLRLYYAYCVTEEDVERGYIENTATASYGLVGGGQYSITSNTVTVKTGKGVKENSGDVFLSKSVVSTPRNGEFYVEGEIIDFAITVSIPANDTMGSAILWDALAESPVGQWSDVASGFTVTLPLYYTVTAGDVEAGEVSNVAWLEWKGKDGAEDGYLYSNYVFVPTGIEEEVAPFYPTVEKVVYEFSHPANGMFYVEGETVLFDVIVRNPVSGEPMSNVVIYDYCQDGVQAYECERTIEPGGFYIAGFSFTVTAEDAQRGRLMNEAWVEYDWPGPLHRASSSVFCDVPCGMEEDAASSYAFIEKKVLSMPNNGMYYVPGEMVSYQITLTNISEQLLQDVAIYDFGEYLGGTAALNRGASFQTVYSAPVSEGDAAVGWKNNIASANFAIYGIDPWFTIYSNMVTVPTGFEGGFGVITDLSVSKTETSTPQNGSYYTLGETITYDITVTNSGETSFDEVIVYDALVPGSGEIASIENFYPGSSRSYSFSHTVHQGDIDTGYVVNSASAMGYSSAGSFYVGSNLVVSDTDGEDDGILCPPIMITPPPPGGFDGPGSLPGGEGNSCDCKLIQQGDGSWVYEHSYCGIHSGTRTAVAEMLAKGSSPAVISMAKELWEKDIEELYDQLALHGDSLAKTNLMESKVAFYTMLKNREAILTLLFPEDPGKVANLVLSTMEDHVNALCYILYHAPEQRSDKLTANIPAPANLYAGEICSIMQEEQEGKLIKSFTLCSEHMPLSENASILLNTTTPVRAWSAIQRLWQMELQGAYNGLFSALSQDADKTIAAAYYRSVIEYAKAYEILLQALYKGQVDTVAETVTKLLREAMMEFDNFLALAPEPESEPAGDTDSGKGFRSKKQ